MTGTLPRSTPAGGSSAPARPERRSGRRLPWRTLVAVLGGLALFLAFPGHSLTTLAVLGPKFRSDCQDSQ